jgi:hypothetical protein
MADPRSVSASIIAVLSACISVGKTLSTAIQWYREVPTVITALSNEISDSVLVLSEIGNRNLDETMERLRTVLGRANDKLEELKTFMEGLGVLGVAGPKRTLDRAKWVGKKKKAVDLKKELAEIKVDIVLLMNSGILQVASVV